MVNSGDMADPVTDAQFETSTGQVVAVEPETSTLPVDDDSGSSRDKESEEEREEPMKRATRTRGSGRKPSSSKTSANTHKEKPPSTKSTRGKGSVRASSRRSTSQAASTVPLVRAKPKVKRSNGRRATAVNDEADVEDGAMMDESDPDDDDDDTGLTRCICGKVEEGDEGDFMIQCDTCKTWQHGFCMGLRDESSCPETYYCNRCRPDLHPLNGRADSDIQILNIGTSHSTAGTTAHPTSTSANSNTAKETSSGHRSRANSVSATSKDAKRSSSESSERRSEEPIATSSVPPATTVKSHHRRRTSDNLYASAASHFHAAHGPRKRSTMNSRDAAYEEQLAQALKLSKVAAGIPEEGDMSTDGDSKAGIELAKDAAADHIDDTVPPTLVGADKEDAEGVDKVEVQEEEEEEAIVDDKSQMAVKSGRGGKRKHQATDSPEDADSTHAGDDVSMDMGSMKSTNAKTGRGRTKRKRVDPDMLVEDDMVSQLDRAVSPTLDTSPPPSPAAFEGPPERERAASRRGGRGGARRGNGRKKAASPITEEEAYMEPSESKNASRGRGRGWRGKVAGGSRAKTSPQKRGGMDKNKVSAASMPFDPTNMDWGLPDHLAHLSHLLPAPTPALLAVPALDSKNTVSSSGQNSGAPSPAGSSSSGSSSKPVQLEVPTRIRFPPKRMSIPEMKKRTKNMLDYLAKVQLDMANKTSQPTFPTDSPGTTLSPGTSSGSSGGEAADASTAALMDDLSRSLIHFQQTFFNSTSR